MTSDESGKRGSAESELEYASERTGDAGVHTFRPRIRAMYSLLIVVVCATVAEVLLKLGANQTAGTSESLMGFSALASMYTVVGIVVHIAAFGSWLYTLKSVPLSLAFNFTSVQQVTVPLAAWVFVYGERMSGMRLVGIGVVLAGVVMLVPAIVEAEKRTEGER